jgi:hypothetical protein
MLGDLLELRPGATPRAVSGVRSIRRLCSSIVIDCRSRQAACGPREPGRIARVTVEDLAFTCESIGEANERRKPDRSGKAARSVAGAACECRRSTCRWKALRAGKAALVDARVVEAVLALRFTVRLVRAAAGSDRERQRSGCQLRRRLKTPRRSGPVKRGPCPPQRNNAEEASEESRPKLVGRRQPSRYPGLDCRKVVRRRAPAGVRGL